jgi:MFS family permease
MSSVPQAQPIVAVRLLPWPKRFDVALLGFLAQLIAYCDRVNISVAAPLISAEYGWSTEKIGWVFSGFFTGYMLLLIPMGYMADRFGPRRTLAAGMTWWSLVTLLTPFCRSVPIMGGARVLTGMGESATIPSINGMLVRWFPPEEYSRAAGFCWGGGFAGAILAFPLASGIAAVWGWRAIFALFSLLGLVWLPFWLLGTRDVPGSAVETKCEKASGLDFREVFRHPAVWGVFGLHFSSNWFIYVLVSWLPTYLLSNRGFSLSQMAFGSSLPFLAAFLGTNIAGHLIDRLTRIDNRVGVRKLFLIPSLIGTSSLLAVPFMHTPVQIVAALSVAMFLHATSIPVQASNSIDLAPRHASTLVGFQNCFANLAGIAAPVITGYMVQSTGWLSAFLLTTVVGCIGVAGFLLFGKAEPILD